MHKIEVNVNFLDLVEQIWKQETKNWSCAQYDEEEDILYYTAEIDDPQRSFPEYVKTKITCSPKKEKILKGLWLLKENL